MLKAGDPSHQPEGKNIYVYIRRKVYNQQNVTPTYLSSTINPDPPFCCSNHSSSTKIKSSLWPSHAMAMATPQQPQHFFCQMWPQQIAQDGIALTVQMQPASAGGGTVWLGGWVVGWLVCWLVGCWLVGWLFLPNKRTVVAWLKMYENYESCRF